jgi:hemolysin III
LHIAEPVNALTHLLGALVALLASVDLLRRGGADRERVVSLAIYVVGVVCMLTASGVYHLAGPDHPDHLLLQRFDHAAIWLQIAGTFTPVHVIFFRGAWRVAPLVVVWTAAALGVVLKLFFFASVSEGPGLYLALGWFGVISCGQLIRERGWATLAPMFLGGVSYSVGAIVERFRLLTPLPGVVGPHELFHLAVLGGVLFHWRFIRRWAGEVLPPARTATVPVPIELAPRPAAAA